MAGRRVAPARPAVVFHYLTKIESPALRRPTPADVQDMRHERRVARQAPLIMAMSRGSRTHRGRRRADGLSRSAGTRRSGRHAGGRAAGVVELGAEPHGAGTTAHALAGGTTRCRVRVCCSPGAASTRAGVGTIGGVEQVGAVGVPADVLARAVVVAYPCPGTSGPKVKVIEALAYGVPVVTTRSGIEGLQVPPEDEPVVADDARFADALIALLRDPARRADLAARGRSAVVASHAPLAAARIRIGAIAKVESV